MIQQFFDVFKALLPDGVECLLGAEHLNENDSPPRIVVVPNTGQFDAGGGEPGMNPLTGLRATPRGTRTLNVDIVIWGADLPTTDAVADEVYVLLCRNFRFDGPIREEWDTDRYVMQEGFTIALTVPLTSLLWEGAEFTQLQSFRCSSCQS